ncbi:hypothetical protein GQ54DRAFT_296909 [Martensiomyces pterosporus]|nr:hypothetical protein GQ54DRAFT_296909 [Martensiomyces pterosporus]
MATENTAETRDTAGSSVDEQGEPIVTAYSYLEQQADLEREAAEVLPGKFDECTFDQGYIRQPLYACLTCTQPPAKYCQHAQSSIGSAEETPPAGMCYSCSIECHTGHEVIELFAKRHFRCDCGTRRLLPAGQQDSCCELKKTRSMLARLENTENCYNHNFWGFYCRCDKYYNPDAESGLMVQCYICNDWFHDRCIGKIPSESNYEDYICRECVGKYDILRCIDTTKLYRGLVADGVVVQLESANGTPYKQNYTVNEDTESQPATVELQPDEAGDAAGEPLKKKAKTSACRLTKDTPILASRKRFDMFMVDGWKDDICTCLDCMKKIEASSLIFLIKEDDIVEPEMDETCGESLYESALKQLRAMDHTRAVDAASAYQSLSSRLKEYLRPFASSGKVVTQQDINAFFEQQSQKLGCDSPDV